MIIARQTTAIIVTVGPVLDADGVAVTDGVVADFKVAKNGAAPAALNGSATLTHRHTGFYSLALTATDVNTVGTAEIVIDDTVNACPMKEITVVEEAVYDALFVASAAGYMATYTQPTGFLAATFPSGTIANTTNITAGTLTTVTTVTTATNLTNLPTIPANWLTAVNTEVDTALADIHLDHLLAVDYDPASKPGVATALFNELIESDAGVSRYTTNALEQGPSGGGGVADWTADERTALRAILGIPASGTTPADPSTGLLDTIRDKTALLPASPAAVGSAMTLTSGERDSIADAYLDRSNGVETGKTPRQYMRAVGAVIAGKISGAGTGSEVFVGLDASTTRVTVTVDSSGNRTAVVYG